MFPVRSCVCLTSANTETLESSEALGPNYPLSRVLRASMFESAGFDSTDSSPFESILLRVGLLFFFCDVGFRHLEEGALKKDPDSIPAKQEPRKVRDFDAF